MTNDQTQKELEATIKTHTGLSPITDSDEEDVFVVGYPKSGSTWFQYLVTGAIYGIDPQHIPDTVVQELIPDVHYKRYYKRFATPMFFKSHHLPRAEYRRVIYLLRDGRDVMVSYFHHLSAMREETPDFTTMVESGGGLFPCKWHHHVEEWLSNPYEAEMIIVKYEDLKRDTVNQLKRLCEFVNVERDEALLAMIANNASFDLMRCKEKEGRYARENPLWPEDASFFRRGVIGSHKTEMPPNVLRIFLEEAKGTLHQCQYL